MPKPAKLKYRLMMLALGGAFALASLAGSSAQDAPPANDLVILDFKPGFDDMMTMMIQPRHIKLYYAGQEENWVLARFQMNELRAAFGRIGDTIPDFGFFPVDDAVEATMTEPFTQMQAAIDASDPQAFGAAYTAVTEACNACHQAMHFPFLVVKEPDADAPNPFVNQDFAPVEGLR
jgi:hypothetical protein